MVDYIATSRRILAEHKHPSFSRDYMQAALDRVDELEHENRVLLAALSMMNEGMNAEDALRAAKGED